MPDERLEPWREWCHGPIRHHVINVHAHRYVWQQLQAIIVANPRVPASYWWIFLQETYAVSQAVAVRRQADMRRDAISPARLMTGVQACAARITRDDWLAMWTADDQERARALWDAEFAGSTGTHLDPAIPTADGKRLREAAKRVKGYVDQHVAHTAAYAVAEQITLTYDDLHEAIEFIGELYRRYHHLLTATSYGSLVPIMHPGWTDVFKQPWMASPPAAQDQLD